MTIQLCMPPTGFLGNRGGIPDLLVFFELFTCFAIGYLFGLVTM